MHLDTRASICQKSREKVKKGTFYEELMRELPEQDRVLHRVEGRREGEIDAMRFDSLTHVALDTVEHVDQAIGGTAATEVGNVDRGEQLETKHVSTESVDWYLFQDLGDVAGERDRA